MYFVDRTGLTYGRLKVIRLYSMIKSGTVWLCKCSCGHVVKVRGGSLSTGNTKSCGCLAVENGRKQGLSALKHGEARHSSRTKTYNIWQGMLRRCDTPSAVGYKNYGGRGVKVCNEWKNYKIFLKDMGHCPLGMSIDRINNDGNYCKLNCKWSTRKEQNSNSRKTIHLVYKNKKQCLSDWAREIRMPITTFWRRIKQGKNIKDILDEQRI